uniref:Uncharacterized protein n=1 Tax=Arundo donax TaxID=35708 RepID=A0A0A9FJN6_ARUDO
MKGRHAAKEGKTRTKLTTNNSFKHTIKGLPHTNKRRNQTNIDRSAAPVSLERSRMTMGNELEVMFIGLEMYLASHFLPSLTSPSESLPSFPFPTPLFNPTSISALTFHRPPPLILCLPPSWPPPRPRQHSDFAPTWPPQPSQRDGYSS